MSGYSMIRLLTTVIEIPAVLRAEIYKLQN